MSFLFSFSSGVYYLNRNFDKINECIFKSILCKRIKQLKTYPIKSSVRPTNYYYGEVTMFNKTVLFSIKHLI